MSRVWVWLLGRNVDPPDDAIHGICQHGHAVAPSGGGRGGDLDEQPLPPDQPIGQVRPNVGEARLDHIGASAALRVDDRWPWSGCMVQLDHSPGRRAEWSAQPMWAGPCRCHRVLSFAVAMPHLPELTGKRATNDGIGDHGIGWEPAMTEPHPFRRALEARDIEAMVT
jgi:hypothetical protein